MTSGRDLSWMSPISLFEVHVPTLLAESVRNGRTASSSQLVDSQRDIFGDKCAYDPGCYHRLRCCVPDCGRHFFDHPLSRCRADSERRQDILDEANFPTSIVEVGLEKGFDLALHDHSSAEGKHWAGSPSLVVIWLIIRRRERAFSPRCIGVPCI